MAYSFLSNYRFFGNPSANSVRFIRTDESVTHRRDLTISRKQSVYNAATEVASIPEYRIVFRSDAQVGDPVKPNGQRMTLDLTIRTPLQPSQADFEQSVSELATMLQNPDFIQDVLQQVFPCVPCKDGEEGGGQ